jgi:hypothetical protein
MGRRIEPQLASTTSAAVAGSSRSSSFVTFSHFRACSVIPNTYGLDGIGKN